MKKHNLNSSESKTFIGSQNYDESRDFYVALGFTFNFETGERELGGCRFYLQNYHQRQWCENSMLHSTVKGAEAWFKQVKAILI